MNDILGMTLVVVIAIGVVAIISAICAIVSVRTNNYKGAFILTRLENTDTSIGNVTKYMKLTNSFYEKE